MNKRAEIISRMIDSPPPTYNGRELLIFLALVIIVITLLAIGAR